jgi:hypothetical protein
MKKTLNRSRNVSKLLTAIAFVLDLVWKDYVGAFVALMIGTFGLFLFLETLNVPKLRTEDGLEEKHFHSACGILFFLIGATVTKILFPFLITCEDFLLCFVAAVAYISILFVVYRAWDVTVWKRHKLVAKGSVNLQAKIEYDRVTNSTALLCLFLSIDGADLMYLLNFLVSFSHEIALTAKSVKLAILRMTRSIRRGKLRSNTRIFKDIDDRLWKRPFYSKKLTAGVPLLTFSFIACLPSALISYQINLFNVNYVLLVIMIALSAPGLVAVLVVEPPWRIGRGRGRKFRNRILAISFLPPILVSITHLLFSFPNLSLPLPAWIFTMLTGVLGLPLLQGLTSMEENHYGQAIRWMKTVAFGAFSILLVVGVYGYGNSQGFQGFFQPPFVFFCCIVLFMCSAIFWFLLQSLYVQFIEGYKEIEGRQVDNWVDMILVPGLNIETFASTIGFGCLLGIVCLAVFAFFGWRGIVLNALVSLTFGFVAGKLLQKRSDRGMRGALSIALFEILGCTVSIIAFFLSLFVVSLDSFVNALPSLGFLLFASAFWTIPIGTILTSPSGRKKIANKICKRETHTEAS